MCLNRAVDDHIDKGLRKNLARWVIGRAEQHGFRFVFFPDSIQLIDDALRVRSRQIVPRLRIQDPQLDDLNVGNSEGELTFIIRVRWIQQKNGVARIKNRAEKIEGDLRTADTDRDIGSSQTLYPE